MLILPVSHLDVIYGSLALVAVMVAGFAAEIARGAARTYNTYPALGEPNGGGAGTLFRAFLETIFLDALAAEPMAVCHVQAYYERKPHVKRAAHLLIFYGFVFLIVSTVLGFLFDRWVTQSSFIPSYYLGLAGYYAEVGLGVAGGLMILSGVALYWPYRNRGERWSVLSVADTFIVLLALTVLSGFALEIAEATLSFVAIDVAFWIHMALVFALFATMPFTKFSHALYQLIWNTYDRYMKKLLGGET